MDSMKDLRRAKTIRFFGIGLITIYMALNGVIAVLSIAQL
jgi:hypothetical protein